MDKNRDRNFAVVSSEAPTGALNFTATECDVSKWVAESVTKKFGLGIGLVQIFGLISHPAAAGFSLSPDDPQTSVMPFNLDQKYHFIAE